VAFLPLPPVAAWRHVDARDGFEAVFFSPRPPGTRIEGRTCGVEDGVVWDVGYAIDVDERWHTTRAEVWSRSEAGRAHTTLEAAGGNPRAGAWLVDGRPAPVVDGCLDVDLESSACTNLLPIRRLALTVGAGASAPAAYVRAPGLEVERLEQSYQRLDDGDGPRFHYTSPRFDIRCVLRYDAAGLVVDYPELAVRLR
jgi:hypothetical protein